MPDLNAPPEAAVSVALDSFHAAVHASATNLDAMRFVVAAIAEDFWLVPKIAHVESAWVNEPHLRSGGLISRNADVADVEHTRRYAAQLLAAADEAERDEGVPVRPYIARPSGKESGRG